MDLTAVIKRILGDKVDDDDLAKLGKELPKPDEGIEKLLARLETQTSNPEIVRTFREMLDAKDAEIASLRSTVDDQKGKLSAYETEKAEREKVLADEKEKQKSEQVEKLLEDAKNDGRLPADNDEVVGNYRALLAADIDNGTKVLEALPKRSTSTTQKTETPKGDGNDKGVPSIEQIEQDALAAFTNGTDS